MLERPANEHRDPGRKLLLRRDDIDQEPHFLRLHVGLRFELAHDRVLAIDAEVQMHAFGRKADAPLEREIERTEGGIPVSALKGVGIGELKEALTDAVALVQRTALAQREEAKELAAQYR